MNDFTFKPWIGPLYNQSGLYGLKILALGESHYDVPSGEQKMFTQNVVKTNAINGRSSFFTITAKALALKGAGQWISQDEKRDVWERIAFYNYVQTPMSGPRIRPSEHMWTEAKPYFERVLRELEPDLVLVLGKALGNHVEASQSAEFCFVNHPSSGFKYAAWLPTIRESIFKAGGSLQRHI